MALNRRSSFRSSEYDAICRLYIRPNIFIINPHTVKDFNRWLSNEQKKINTCETNFENMETVLVPLPVY